MKIFRVVIDNIKFVLRISQVLFPAFFYLLYYSNKNKYSLVKKDTELLIDGFPRSANTFAYTFIELTQPVKKIAHHVHLPVQFYRGIRFRTPAVLLLRNPVDAAISMSIRRPTYFPYLIFLYYYLFHKKIWEIINDTLVIKFEEVISDPNSIIRKLRSKNCSGLSEVELTDKLKERINKRVDELDMKNRNDSEIKNSTVARPTEYRKNISAKLRREFNSKRYNRISTKCFHIYNSIIDSIKE
ncbi:MAG TPA: hypothetical protein PLZ15_02460 [Melioribacteraceae bacterium]|nr:hypothetical protein [Melioribacteraceae bacterium]